VRLAFLETKFTSAELYEYMRGVLGGFYRYLLQRATAVARLAEQHSSAKPRCPATLSAPTGHRPPATVLAPDDARRLTGSARLLQACPAVFFAASLEELLTEAKPRMPPHPVTAPRRPRTVLRRMDRPTPVWAPAPPPSG
jgi:hypothetical protein